MSTNKIGLAVTHRYYNYGTMLQAFATFHKIKSLGYDPEIINFRGIYRTIRNRKLFYYAKKLIDPSVVREKSQIVFSKLRAKFNKDFGRNIAIRKRAFDDFCDKNFTVSREFSSWEDLSNSCNNYSAVIVGSDQLWLPSNIAGDFFTLNFVPDNIKKISYATSFGVSYVEKSQREKARKFLSRINFLSVREKSGQEIIKSLTGRDAELVCDPTMLMTSQEWDNCVHSNNISKYIYQVYYL